MKEDQLDIVKMRLSDISDYSLAQFFDLTLAEMHSRDAGQEGTWRMALWKALNTDVSLATWLCKDVPDPDPSDLVA